MKNKKLIIKIVKTFFQGFLAYIIGTNIIPDETNEYIKVLLIGACAAGLSALMNIDYDKLEQEETVEEEEELEEEVEEIVH